MTPWSTHDFFIGPDAFRNIFAYLPQLRNDFKSTRFRLFAPRNYPDSWGIGQRWIPDQETPFEQCRILEPRPNRKELDRILGYFAHAFPQIGKPPVRSSWAGMIDTMPDLLPLVDKAPIGGLTIATGMSGHGFGIGPGIAEVVADLVRERPVQYDISRFALDRSH